VHALGVISQSFMGDSASHRIPDLVRHQKAFASVEGSPRPCHSTRMQQKTEGRVVRLLSKHLAAEDRAVEQWFLVAIDDDEKAKETISKTAKGVNEVVEVIGNIPASRLANWGLTDGEVRLVLPGEPLTESQ
jgi:hypothetical protein